MSGSILETQALEKTFVSKRGSVLALTRTDLRVPKGSFVAVVGPSGCGKTTLLRILAGLETPSSGRVLLEGSDVTGPSPLVGVMFQRPVLLPWRSVLDNVLLPVSVARMKPADFVDSARKLLDQVNLSGFEERQPRELSGGMQQRVALARALIKDPDLLLLDEPFGALDSITREQLNDLLAEVRRATGKTVILVTHDIDEAVYLADMVVVMSPRPGRVVKEMEIDLPHPRTAAVRRSQRFLDYSMNIRTVLGLGAA